MGMFCLFFTNTKWYIFKVYNMLQYMFTLWNGMFTIVRLIQVHHLRATFCVW